MPEAFSYNRSDLEQLTPYLHEINVGDNALLYGQLQDNRQAFDSDTWNLGINYFFLGKRAFKASAQVYVEQGIVFFPDVEGDDGNLIDMDWARAMELRRGEFRLPKKWDDIYDLAQERLVEVAGIMRPANQAIEDYDVAMRNDVIEMVTNGTQLESSEIPEELIETIKELYFWHKHLQAMKNAVGIVDELWQEGKLTDTLRRIPGERAYLSG